MTDAIKRIYMQALVKGEPVNYGMDFFPNNKIIIVLSGPKSPMDIGVILEPVEKV